MTKEMLFDAALRYKKTKLWQKLWDNELFAIKLTNGETGYICVMGKGGEHCSLALYIGEAGFQSYRIIANASFDAESEFEFREMLMQQDSLQMTLDNKDMMLPEEVEEARAYGKAHGIRFSGKNAYPTFVKYTPNHYPWKVKTDDDMQLLHEALEAAILIAELLKTSKPRDIGIIETTPITLEVPLFEVKENHINRIGTAPLPGDKEETYEFIELKNDILTGSVKRLKKHGIWEAKLIRVVKPVQDDPEEAPYFPLMLLMAEKESHYLLPTPMLAKGEDFQKILVNLANAWKNEGIRPQEIRCEDERTYALLKLFSEKIGAKISIYKGDLEALWDVENELLRYMADEEDLPEDELFDILDAVLEMSSEELKSMPPQLRDELINLIDSGVLPDEIADELMWKLGIG